MNSTHAFFHWLLRSSWQAAVLTVLVVLAQFCLGKRLDARWRHWLWFLVVIRLVVPSTPSSPASLFNYFHLHPASMARVNPSVSPSAAIPAATIPTIAAANKAKLSLPPSQISSLPQPALAVRKLQQGRSTKPDWIVVLACVWGLGVAVLGARVVVQNTLFRRRLQTARPVEDPAMPNLFTDCRRSAVEFKPVEVVETELVSSPALYGLFKLRLLLPPEFSKRFAPAEIRHIFLHELSHIRRHDMEVQWLVTGLQIFHWFNPILWFGFRRMAADRELAGDELALSFTGEENAADYGHTIVKLLERATESPPLPGLVGIMEDKKQIFRRVTMIASFKRHPRWSAVGVATAVALGVATLTGAQTEKGPGDSAQLTNVPGAVGKGKVDQRVAEIAAGWEDMSVFEDVEAYCPQVRELVQIGKPAVPGLCAALDGTKRDMPMRLLGFTLRAIGDPAAVPALVRAIPKTLLPPGSDCGGMAPADPALLKFMTTNQLEPDAENARGFDLGRPVREIGGAIAKITGTNVQQEEIYSLFLDGGETQRAAERKAFHDVDARWADWWQANHGRFVSDPALVAVHLPELEVGKPVTSSSHFLTGPNIRLSDCTKGEMVSPFAMGTNCGLSLTLGRDWGLPQPLMAASGSKMSVEDARALAETAGVDVLGDEYRDPQSGKLFYALRGVGLKAWEIPNEQWSKIGQELQSGNLPSLDTPAREWLMHFDTASARYVPGRRATFLFMARDGSQGILRVTGQVTRDFAPSDFGIPATPLDESNPDQTSDAGFSLGVKFGYRFFYEETPQLRAEEKSRREAREAREKRRAQQTANKQLQKYPHLTGTVLAPGGKPASNAQIVVIGNGQVATLFQKQFAHTQNQTMITTGADGSYEIPLIPYGRAFIAHEDGYAEVDLHGVTTPLSISLAAWGRIEGAMTLEGKPAPNQTVGLYDEPDALMTGEPSPPRCLVSAQTNSDDEGRFVFEGMPPGEIDVWRMVNNTFFEPQHCEVAAGKTTVFRHGFDGRIVRGRLMASASEPVENWNASTFTRFNNKQEVPDPPKDENPADWSTRYWASDAGKKALRAHVNFAVSVDPSGSFEIRDVPPGIYSLEADLHEGAVSIFNMGGRTLGRLKQDVEIPQENNAADTPVDLGELALKMSVHLKPGAFAPDFEVKTIEDQPLHLADFKGRYVLVDFWATWCGPCRGEAPNLKAISDAFGANPKFAMIGLSLDKSAADPKQYCQTNGMTWPQGFLGDWSKATLPAKFGVEGIPSIFLLDPDGKIVATDLRGDKIKTAVAAALAGR